MGEISDEFIGLDAATQAFILMLVADMVVGYHSSDGWQALLAVIITHYGLDFHKFEMAVRIFVAVVPVTLDIGFKYWVFNKLRKISPSPAKLSWVKLSATERCNAHSRHSR